MPSHALATLQPRDWTRNASTIEADYDMAEASGVYICDVHSALHPNTLLIGR